MSGKSWAGEVGDPFATDGDDGDAYKPWRVNSGGFVRDLKLVAAPGSGEVTRFVPYMQAITLELAPDGQQLALMCHTSGHLIFITGQGLGELAEQISAKRIQSVHVHDANHHGAAPDAVVTGLRVERPDAR